MDFKKILILFSLIMVIFTVNAVCASDLNDDFQVLSDVHDDDALGDAASDSFTALNKTIMESSEDSVILNQNYNF